MSCMALPIVRRISGPEAYPFSRAKVQVGDDWYIIVDRIGGPILSPCLFVHDSPTDPAMAIATMAYRCLRCNTTFMAYDLTDYIHKCCEVE